MPEATLSSPGDADSSDSPGTRRPRIMPYSALVGQGQLSLALELAFVNRALGGVLISGPRGTAKSTAVRAFAVMSSGELPVTLPLGATIDRVVGGWKVEKLLEGVTEEMEGLLRQAAKSLAGLLYVDEVNLLDDYLVDALLDVAASGILHAEREGLTSTREDVRFTLVGTMNPDEGGLRPQLLDRFGLVATAEVHGSGAERAEIIRAAMLFEEAREEDGHPFWAKYTDSDDEAKRRLIKAREDLPKVAWDGVVDDCAHIADRLEVVGHRGPLALVHAARAMAALDGRFVVDHDDIRAVAGLALVHRRAKNESDTVPEWTEADARQVEDILGG